MTHAEALARVREIRGAESGLHPACGVGLHDHGRRTERAIVLIHGFTNCPAMYRQLAARLHEGGANVLVPRLPRHGLADRLTRELSHLNAAEMERAAVEAAEIATGLGSRVTVAGLSLGGVLAGWLAQFQPGVDRAVIVSPLFCAPVVPEWLSDLAGFVADRMPNLYLWWDPKAKAAVAGPPHAYPGFPTHAYGEMLRLGYEVKQAAGREPPKCPDIRVITNLNDPAVNNVATRRLVAQWRAHGANVATHQFPRERGLLHDLVSPDQVYARTAEVYPLLIDWITTDVTLACDEKG
jgi:pimeloyl-ACP methyl ester carboxylesterase